MQRLQDLWTLTADGLRDVVRRKLPVLVVTLLAMGSVAIPAASLETSFPDEGQLSEEATQRRAYDLLAAGFGPGSNGPLVVVVETDQPAGAAPVLETVAERLRTVEGWPSWRRRCRARPATPSC